MALKIIFLGFFFKFSTWKVFCHFFKYFSASLFFFVGLHYMLDWLVFFYISLELGSLLRFFVIFNLLIEVQLYHFSPSFSPLKLTASFLIFSVTYTHTHIRAHLYVCTYIYNYNQLSSFLLMCLWFQD